MKHLGGNPTSRADPGGSGGLGGGGDGPDPDSGRGLVSVHGSMAGPSDEVPVRKLRETDEVNVPSLPSVVGFRAWKLAVYQSVSAAAGREDDMALWWVRQAEDESVSLDDLSGTTRHFTTLSRKLAAALQKVATSEIGRKITTVTEGYMKRNKAVSGLVGLRLNRRVLQRE